MSFGPMVFDQKAWSHLKRVYFWFWFKTKAMPSEQRPGQSWTEQKSQNILRILFWQNSLWIRFSFWCHAGKMEQRTFKNVNDSWNTKTTFNLGPIL